MQRRIILLVIFLVGIVFGCVLMGFLSMRGSNIYLEMVKTNYIQEQEFIADQFWMRGNLNEAVIHYHNAVQALSGTGLKAFNPDHMKWSFGFPFAAIVLNAITEKSNKTGGRVIFEGINRGKLGMVLESLGRHEEAHREYLYAAELMHVNEIERVKRIVKGIMDKQKELLERNTSFIFQLEKDPTFIQPNKQNRGSNKQKETE